jgi:hypothetical protein
LIDSGANGCRLGTGADVTDEVCRVVELADDRGVGVLVADWIAPAYAEGVPHLVAAFEHAAAVHDRSAAVHERAAAFYAKYGKLDAVARELECARRDRGGRRP